MTPDVLQEEITNLVRSGFFSNEHILEILCEEMYAGELDPEEVSSAIDEEARKLALEQKNWPAETDCDRLDRVFVALQDHGIAALQNAGVMQDDGYDAVWEAFPDASDDENTVGYCFYTSQDLETALRGSGLYLAFGPVDPKDEKTKGLEAGRIIRKALEEAGFAVTWNGSFDQRILIPKLDWKRRFRDDDGY